MMPIERMRPEDFDAVFRLLSQNFPAGAQGTVDCADLLSMAMMIDSGAWIITYADLGQQAFPLRLTSIENPEHFSARREIKQHSARRESAGAVLFQRGRCMPHDSMPWTYESTFFVSGRASPEALCVWLMLTSTT